MAQTYASFFSGLLQNHFSITISQPVSVVRQKMFISRCSASVVSAGRCPNRETRKSLSMASGFYIRCDVLEGALEVLVGDKLTRSLMCSPLMSSPSPIGPFGDKLCNPPAAVPLVLGC